MSTTIKKIDVSCDRDTSNSISKWIIVTKRCHPTNKICIDLDYKTDSFTLSKNQAKQLVKALKEIYTNI